MIREAEQNGARDDSVWNMCGMDWFILTAAFALVRIVPYLCFKTSFDTMSFTSKDSPSILYVERTKLKSGGNRKSRCGMAQ